jgi:HEAT repeat protein
VETLGGLLKDSSGSVRVAAAEALCRAGRAEQGLKALAELLLDGENPRVRLQALNAVDHLGSAAKSIVDSVERARQDSDDYVKRAARYSAAILRGRAAPIEGRD